MTIRDCFYIDTRPGQVSLFAPPEPVEDYRTWLTDRYEYSSGKGSGFSFGVAQQIHVVIHRCKSEYYDISVRAFGIYAGAAAEVVHEISKGVVDVEVLG